MIRPLTRCLAAWPMICLMAALACGGDDPPQPPSAHVLKVRLAEAVGAVIDEDAAFEAVLAAKETVEVRAKVKGYLLERLFEEGALVNLDDPLYKLDDRDLKAEYEAAQANTAQAETVWKNDEVNKERFVVLAEKEAVSLRERDNAVTRAESSLAAFQAAQAQEELAAVNLGYAVINAPVAGFADRSQVDVGALVEAGGTLLTTIYRLDPIRAEFSITDREYAHFQEVVVQERGGDPKSIKFRLYLGDDRRLYPHEGVLEMADPVVDSRTRTMGVRAEFPNPGNVLRPGQFVNVVGVFDQREVVTVPDEAVVDGAQGGKAVYVVDEKNTLAALPVTVGRTEGGRRVILEGLTPGQKVVVEGLVMARPGLPVEVVEPEPAAP